MTSNQKTKSLTEMLGKLAGRLTDLTPYHQLASDFTEYIEPTKRKQFP
jgi:hypothetical protein